jgi:hypothetical protein
MDAPITIEKFSSLLKSDQEDSPLLTALSKLTAIEEPEDVIAAAAKPLRYWFGWS